VKLLLLVLVIVVLLGVLPIVFRLLRPSLSKDWPFYVKKPLTQPEQVLYHRLVKALPECVVLAQVQLSRLLGVKKGANFGVWNNRINRLSLDYLVCLKDSTVVAAIELDDSSHGKASRREADARKENALKSAGVPLLRWSVSALPDISAIREAIDAAPSSSGRRAD
jgi:very-short-patch-repair endonuclease